MRGFGTFRGTQLGINVPHYTSQFDYKKEEKSLMKYRVNLKKTEEGYSVWVPGLPGCWSQGKSEAEALENVKDAISAYLETVDKITTDKETRYVEIAYA